MDNEKELVKHAAVKTVCGQIMFGKHHADCFHKGFNMGFKMCSKADSQGFMTNKGRFVTRMEGGEIAYNGGQIEKPNDFLFSEDMWSGQYRAKHNHDEVKGYIAR